MTPADYKGPERRRGGPDRREPGARIKILLVDDHALYRVGMRQTLDVEADFDIVAEAEDSRGAIDAAAAHTPDIVLLDLSLPPPGGIETTQRVKREVPSAGIICPLMGFSLIAFTNSLFASLKASGSVIWGPFLPPCSTTSAFNLLAPITAPIPPRPAARHG